jgi:hypothetical protein
MRQSSQLLINYIEGVLLKNQELHDQATENEMRSDRTQQ